MHPPPAIQLSSSPALAGIATPPTTPDGNTLLPSGVVTYECGRCESQSIVDDFEYVSGKGRIKYKKCMTCSSRDIREVTMIKKKCSTPDCGRPVQKDGLCYKCYVNKYGKPPYHSQRTVRQTAHNENHAGSPEVRKDLTPLAPVQESGPSKKIKHRTCIVPGCDKYRVRNQMCTKHWHERMDKKLSGPADPTTRWTRRPDDRATRRLNDDPIRDNTAIRTIENKIAQIESHLTALKTTLEILRSGAA